MVISHLVHALNHRILLRKFFKEPFVHFAVAGALLFIAYAVINRNTPAENAIVVTRNQIDDLKLLWMQKWNSPPTAEELNAIIEDFIEEEILYREALHLRLDEDDKIVRRRLAQKLDFILTDDWIATKPSGEELKNYFEKRKKRYREALRYSLYQITFLGGEAARDKALHTKEIISSITDSAKLKSVGSQTAAPFNLHEKTAGELDRIFGEGFSNRLKELPLNDWQGPVQSGLGFHLVMIYGTQADSIPEFEKVEMKVLEDWMEDEKKKLRESKLMKLRKNYRIVVESDNWNKKVER